MNIDREGGEPSSFEWRNDGMNFKEALEQMKNGIPMKLPSWGGYWLWDGKKKTIMMHCRRKDTDEGQGQVLDIRETQRVEYTLMNILSDEWIPADGANCTILGGKPSFNFDEALKYLKRGFRLTRKGWNGKNLSVVYQKGYPQGIPCNKQTAEAWGMKEGELFKCEPYLQISTVDGSHAMWVPSIRDCLADDWEFVD